MLFDQGILTCDTILDIHGLGCYRLTIVIIFVRQLLFCVLLILSSSETPSAGSSSCRCHDRPSRSAHRQCQEYHEQHRWGDYHHRCDGRPSRSLTVGIIVGLSALRLGAGAGHASLGRRHTHQRAHSRLLRTYCFSLYHLFLSSPQGSGVPSTPGHRGVGLPAVPLSTQLSSHHRLARRRYRRLAVRRSPAGLGRPLLVPLRRRAGLQERAMRPNPPGEVRSKTSLATLA